MTTTVQYDRKTLRAANLAYIKKVHLKHLLWPSLLAGGLLVFAFSGPHDSWLKSFIIVTVLFIPSVAILGYFMRVRHSLKTLDLLEDGKVVFTFDENGVGADSAVAKSQVKWTMFSDLWEAPEAYLLSYTNHQFITLPKAQVNSRVIDYIRMKLRQPIAAANSQQRRP